MLATIDSNKFNHKNKIGEFKYIDIKDLVNNTKNNTISKIDAKKNQNILIKIKGAELKKYEIHTSTQKELLNLFNDLLKSILTDKILMPSKDNVSDNENENENENVNENENENDNDNVNENGNENKNDNVIKKLNNLLDEIIDKSKSFEDQIKLF